MRPMSRARLMSPSRASLTRELLPNLLELDLGGDDAEVPARLAVDPAGAVALGVGRPPDDRPHRTRRGARRHAEAASLTERARQASDDELLGQGHGSRLGPSRAKTVRPASSDRASSRRPARIRTRSSAAITRLARRIPSWFRMWPYSSR